MSYGMPYKGSKNKLAERIVIFFPKATNFYDLFAGGFAITHAALVNGKYENYFASDITFISSYEMPEKYFTCVKEYKHRSTLSATANNKVIEKIFIPKRQKKLYEERKSPEYRQLDLFHEVA